MKIKLMGTEGKLGASLLFGLCYLLINALAYFLCAMLALFVVIPSVDLYSHALFDKMVDPMGYVTQGAAIAVCIVSSVVSACVAAVWSVALEKRRRKQFFSETFGLLTEKAGVAWYIEKYGIINAVSVFVFTLALGLVTSTGLIGISGLLLPQHIVFAGIISNIPAALLCAVVNFASVFYGILLGMRKWRVFCMCND